MYDEVILTFKNCCSGVIQLRFKKISVLGWNNGVLRETTMLSAFTVTKLAQILTYVLQIYQQRKIEKCCDTLYVQ